MLDFGWTSGKYALSKEKKLLKLLRAKALSLAYQYPGCPILDSLSKYALRMTSGVEYEMPLEFDDYKKRRLLKLIEEYGENLPIVDVLFNTRILVENRYNVPISDQLIIESYFDSKNDLLPIDCGVVLLYCNNDQIDYYERYVCFNDRLDLCFVPR
jgi:hypothetical protein